MSVAIAEDSLLTKKQRMQSIQAQLKLTGNSFLGHWRELGEYIMPRRTRFLVTDVNRGDRRSGKIIDSTATAAHGTLRSGMMGGITSPARSWFELTLPGLDNDTENGPIKAWLDEVTRRMNAVFQGSNLYQVLPVNYGDMGTFGLGGILIEEDMDTVINCQSLPIGSFYISNNSRGRVDTMAREFQMTVRQIVEEFVQSDDGTMNWDAVSQMVRDLWNRGTIEYGINVTHMILPNVDYDPNALEAKYKRYCSCYWETGTNGDGRTYDVQGKFLRESGYDEFPGLFSRWEVTGEDAYPTNSPGITSLGDVKQLQFMERKESKAVDKMIDPPMTTPPSLHNKRASILPGDTTPVNSLDEANMFKPAHNVQYDLAASMQKTQQIRQRINANYFVDLFKMLIDDPRNERMTATEVQAKQQEKLLALGPILEQLNYDLLDPLITLVFSIMVRQGLIPPAPQGLEGAPISVKYVSIMAQAQKLVGVGTQERFLGILLQLAPVDPGILDTVDTDKFMETYAHAVSLPFGIIRDVETVAAIRAQRQQQQAQAQKAENAANAAKAAQSLAGADMSGDNALTRLAAQSSAGQLQPQAT